MPDANAPKENVKPNGSMNIKNLLIVIILIVVALILLAILAGIVIFIFKLNDLSSIFGSPMQPNNNGNNYNPNPGSSNYNNNGNYSPGSSQGNQTMNNDLSNLGVALKAAVDKGDWNKANDLMNQIKSMSSQMPPEIAGLMPQFEEAIRNKDQAAFYRLYEQVQNNMNNNYMQNQSNGSNSPGIFSCNAGEVYNGNVPNTAAHVDAIITGMMFHNNRDMCHFTYQINEQGLNVDEDCYFDQKETCCTMSIGGQQQGSETCIAMAG